MPHEDLDIKPPKALIASDNHRFSAEWGILTPVDAKYYSASCRVRFTPELNTFRFENSIPVMGASFSDPDTNGLSIRW